MIAVLSAYLLAFHLHPQSGHSVECAPYSSVRIQRAEMAPPGPVVGNLMAQENTVTVDTGSHRSVEDVGVNPIKGIAVEKPEDLNKMLNFMHNFDAEWM